MLADLERRLAEVLGAGLAPPLRGRVRVTPDRPGGDGPVVQVSVASAVPTQPDLGARRPEPIPGGTSSRPVLRLECEVHLRVLPGAAGAREDVVAGTDALLWLLDDAGLRTGASLHDPGDQGFHLDHLLVTAAAPGDPGDPAGTAGPPQVTLHALGWFWPVGLPEQEGVAIAHALVRQVSLPLALAPSAPPRAGGGRVDLVLTVPAAGTFDLSAGSAVASAFGAVVARLEGRGGQPGAGRLRGGAAGPDGSRVVDLAAGTAALTYQPPPDPGTDDLVVSTFTTTGGERRIGLDLARFPIVTGP